MVSSAVTVMKILILPVLISRQRHRTTFLKLITEQLFMVSILTNTYCVVWVTASTISAANIKQL